MCGSYHSCAVDALWHDLSLAYERHIEATGKEMHFLILLSFLGSFGFIRTSAHMIRAQVSWWPGNVETKGGTHIHHMFWGILLLMTMGYLGLATDMGSPWLELTGIAFGIGLGLTLDEFALWLNLQDVYWSREGPAVDRRRDRGDADARGRADRPAVLDRHRAKRSCSRSASAASASSAPRACRGCWASS